MSWLFSQALAAEYSADTSLDGEQFAQLNVMPTPHKFWRNDKTMEFSNLSRFGLTLRLLTESHGEALLMSYLADFRARTSVSLVQGRESKVPEAGYGRSLPGLFTKFSHDSSSWKTAQFSLLADSELFSETWPRSGSMLNGACYLRPMLEPLTYATASGFWPTPCAMDHSNRQLPERIHITSSGLPKHIGKDGVKSQMRLSQAVKLYPTPIARDCRTVRGGARTVNALGTEPLITHIAEMENRTDGRLNPEWVEWLMGWPTGWTDLKPLETAKFQEWQQQHSLSLQNEQELSEEAA